MDNRHNKLLSFFSFFDKEFNLENCLVNSFSDRFPFHLCSSNIKKHIKDLDNLTFRASSNPFSSIVIFNAGIKNCVTTSILHIHSYDKSVIKTIHKVVNITTTEAELFTIQCGINQAVGITNINHIVVITDSLYAAKRIFDSLLHLYQIQSIVISHELRDFFLKDVNNCIEHQDYSSKPLHTLVNKDFKSFISIPIFPYKLSWDYCKKQKCDFILSQ